MGNGIDFSEFSELAEDGGGYDVKTPVAPEDEHYHAVYISGQQRQNHVGETEMPGKLQIRGVRSNLDQVNVIITNIKNVLVKSSRSQAGRETVECFSYQSGELPWRGTSGTVCGKNATERAANPFCSSCRSQLVIAGIYLDETGKVFLVDGKSIFIFIRAKGVKYGNVANYLSDLSKREDLEPIVTPVTPESQKFERAQINHKRFVTNIKVGKQSTNYGLKDVFELSVGAKLPTDAVKNILNRSKETIEKFKEKFDWSRGKAGGSSDYAAKTVEEDQKFNFGPESSTPPKETKAPPAAAPKASNFSFEDVNF
jgi:hypothetical protein